MTSNEITQRMYQCESHDASWEDLARDLVKVLTVITTNTEKFDLKNNIINRLDDIESELSYTIQLVKDL